MAFGQPAGPPASAKQVQHLLSLLQAAGHSDFRDARGPMGFNQRQAAGRFTREEADAFIERLEQDLDSSRPDASPIDDTTTTRPTTPSAADRPRTSGGTTSGATASRETLSKTEQALRKVPSGVLAAELQRRGWVVMEP